MRSNLKGLYIVLSLVFVIGLLSCSDDGCLTCVTNDVSVMRCPDDTAALNAELGTTDPLTFDEIINLLRNLGAECE